MGMLTAFFETSNCVRNKRYVGNVGIQNRQRIGCLQIIKSSTMSIIPNLDL